MIQHKVELLSKFKILIALSKVDGHLDSQELAFLEQLSEQWGLLPEELTELLSQPSAVDRKTLPKNRVDKRKLIIELLQLARADGQVDDKERRMISRVAANLGLDKDEMKLCVAQAWETPSRSRRRRSGNPPDVTNDSARGARESTDKRRMRQEPRHFNTSEVHHPSNSEVVSDSIKKFIIVAVVLCLIVVTWGGISILISRGLNTELAQADLRLTDANRLASECRQENALSMFWQVEEELNNMNRWYRSDKLMTRVQRKRQELILDRQICETDRKTQHNRIFQRIEEVCRHLRSGSIASAQELTGVALNVCPNSNENLAPTLNDFIRHLSANEFELAAGDIKGLRTVDLGEHAKTASTIMHKIVESFHNAYSRHISEIAGTLSMYIRNINEQAAVALLKKGIDEYSFDPALEAKLHDYFQQLEVQDFEEAISISDSLDGIVRASAFNPVVNAMRETADHKREENSSFQASLASDVQILAYTDQIQKVIWPKLRGRALVWDYTKKNVEYAYQLLPDDLRGSSRDGELTIFCIRKRWNEKVGTYNISKQPAYQEHMELSVVYWPSKISAGATVIDGGLPRSVRPVTYRPEYGSSVEIKKWITALPR